MLKIILSIILVIALLIGVPLAAIWAINTLFNLEIAYTLINWFAALILIAATSGSTGIKWQL